ncbi:MAG: hypothetical protein ACK5IC_09625 [Moheibacter sp.]
MAISKLNKGLSFIIPILLLSSCKDENTIKLEHQKECQCMDALSFWNNQRTIILKSKELKSNKIGLKISHVRNGEIIENLEYKFSEIDNRWIGFTAPNIIYKSDSIIILFKNDREFILHNFINSPNYGGKKFIGCKIDHCKINNMDSIYIGDFIYLE